MHTLKLIFLVNLAPVHEAAVSSCYTGGCALGVCQKEKTPCTAPNNDACLVCIVVFLILFALNSIL